MTTGLRIFCDLEGVLVPEMWPHVAARLGIPALAATTREQPDYAALVATRIAVLRANGVTMTDLCAAVTDMVPYNGAVEFIAAMRKHAPVTLVTDSFAPMNLGLIAAFAVERLLSHRFIPDAAGFIAEGTYWNDLAGKHLCLADAGDFTLAIGDAFNDLTMLRTATIGVLFRPSPETILAGTDLCIATGYPEVIDVLAAMVEDRSPVRRSGHGHFSVATAVTAALLTSACMRRSTKPARTR